MSIRMIEVSPNWLSVFHFFSIEWSILRLWVSLFKDVYTVAPFPSVPTIVLSSTYSSINSHKSIIDDYVVESHSSTSPLGKKVVFLSFFWELLCNKRIKLMWKGLFKGYTIFFLKVSGCTIPNRLYRSFEIPSHCISSAYRRSTYQQNPFSVYTFLLCWPDLELTVYASANTVEKGQSQLAFSIPSPKERIISLLLLSG